MFCMTEHEKREQIGMLAEEVSRIKGELNHINEKLTKALAAYQAMAGPRNINNWVVQNDKVVVVPQAQPSPNIDLGALLNVHELKEVLEHKEHLTSELKIATDRLRGLAPHLL